MHILKWRMHLQGWINKFDEFGTVGNVNKASDDRPTHSGRPRKRTPAVIEAVRVSVENNPKRSVKKRCQSLSLSLSATQRILKDDLNKYTYHIQMAHKITEADKVKRLTMATKILAKNETESRFLSGPP